MAKTGTAKEKLLEAAFDLIWNQSYGAVGVEQICERAGVNKGSFYHFFPSKSDLAVAAYEEDWREKQPRLDRIFSPQNPPLKRLELWCEYIRERQKQRREKYGRVCGCPYSSIGAELATQDEKVRLKVQTLVERNLRYLESALVDASREGLIEIENPKVTAARVYSAALGLLLQARIRNDLRLLDDLTPMITEMVGARAVAC